MRGHQAHDAGLRLDVFRQDFGEAHRTQGIGNEELGERLVGDRARVAGGAADAGVDQDQVELRIAEAVAQGRARGGVGGVHLLDGDLAAGIPGDHLQVAGGGVAPDRADHGPAAFGELLHQAKADTAGGADYEGVRHGKSPVLRLCDIVGGSRRARRARSSP